MEKPTLTHRNISLRAGSSSVVTRPTAQVRSARQKGIYAALASAVFLGLTPIFGKQAILLGAEPLAVVAMRTLFAALILFLGLFLIDRRYLYIYPAGLLGCMLAGWINGIGSLFYYSALGRIDASVGHLLYSLYPFFLIIWLSLDHQPPGRLTIFRLVLAIPAVFLLTQANSGQLDLVGTLQMLIAAALYAFHIPINQRVLYEMPAPTVTVFTLIAMSTVVVPVYLFSRTDPFPGGIQVWTAISGLTLVTLMSRLMLFMGVKHLGGMQTALLGLSELLVAIGFAYGWLGERLSQLQWIGAILLILSLLMVVFEKPTARKGYTTGWLSWLRPSGD